MVAFNAAKAGDTLYDVHRTKMGNTTMSRMGCWEVRVIEVDKENQRIFASWNYNAPRWMSRRAIERLRRSPYKPRKPAP